MNTVDKTVLLTPEGLKELGEKLGIHVVSLDASGIVSGTFINQTFLDKLGRLNSENVPLQDVSLTVEDQQRMAAAELKRARRAAKRMKK